MIDQETKIEKVERITEISRSLYQKIMELPFEEQQHIISLLKTMIIVEFEPDTIKLEGYQCHVGSSIKINPITTIGEEELEKIIKEAVKNITKNNPVY